MDPINVDTIENQSRNELAIMGVLLYYMLTKIKLSSKGTSGQFK